MQTFYTLKAGDVEVAGAPETIAVLPLGHVISSKGEFDVDEESLQEMKAGIAQRGVDLVVDYEHQTLKGVQAPAAGWVKKVFIKDGNICANVEWTPAAAQYLANKEYRYLSPVISVRKIDNKATGLHSIALTNTPAIENMTPIVNSENFEGGQSNMELIKQLAQLLDLTEDASEEDVMEALSSCIEENKALKDAGKQPPGDGTQDEKVVANKAVCELLGLKAGAATEDVSAKIMELKGGIVGGINLVAELMALKKESAERTATDAVTLALKSGKITPAQKGWAMEYASSNPKGFADFVAKAPQVVPMSELELADVKSLKSDKPDEATLLICKQLGISEDDLAKYGKE